MSFFVMTTRRSGEDLEHNCRYAPENLIATEAPLPERGGSRPVATGAGSSGGSSLFHQPRQEAHHG